MNNTLFYELLKGYQGKINCFGALCQCNWETRTKDGPWTSELWLRANNAAGLKKWSGWGGPFYDKSSWEQMPSGEKVNRISAFCKYPTPKDFIHNYVDKIVDNYPVCSAQADNFFGYFAGLFKGKYGAWATDQEYFARLCTVALQLAPEVFGEQWHSKLVASLDYALTKGYLTPKQGQMALNVVKGQGTQYKDTRPLPRKNLVVCLDFGHGGTDPGAVRESIREADLNMRIGMAIGKELSKRGVELVYTRVTDIYVSRPERARIANTAGADLFVSVHANAVANPSIYGHEDWIARNASPKAVALANNIQNEWGRMFPKGKLLGTKRRDFDVLVLPKMPSVLTEIGFISNARERADMAMPEMHSMYASVIANAIDRTFRGA